MPSKETVVKPPKIENPMDAMIYNMRAMNQIVEEMRLIPRKERKKMAEDAKNVNALIKVELPKEGGVLTYMEGMDQPYRGFPFWEFVDKLDIFKKIGKSLLSGVYHSLVKKNKVKLITFLPSVWAIKGVVRTAIYVFYRQVERFRLKPNRYCQCVRELYRVFSIQKDKESIETEELRIMIRDAICIFLEFDNAYRFRVQDWMEEFDITKFRKKPIRELKRILDIAIKRETTQEMKDTWILLKRVLLRYLLFDKELKQILVDAFSNLDIEKVKLTKEDICYCRPRKDYIFGFMKK